MSELNYYHLLRIPRTAGPDEIRQAYVRLVKHVHPDLVGTAWRPAARLEDLQRAYRCLLDPKARREHDARIEELELAHAARLRRVERRLWYRSRAIRGAGKRVDVSHRRHRWINWRFVLIVIAGVVVIAKVRTNFAGL